MHSNYICRFSCNAKEIRREYFSISQWRLLASAFHRLHLLELQVLQVHVLTNTFYKIIFEVNCKIYVIMFNLDNVNK